MKSQRRLIQTEFNLNISIPCENQKKLFLIKVNCYLELLFNSYVLVFFEMSDSKEVCILFFISTILMRKLKCNANTTFPKWSSDIILLFHNLLNCFYFLMHHIFLYELKVFKILKPLWKYVFFWHELIFLKIVYWEQNDRSFSLQWKVNINTASTRVDLLKIPGLW